MDVWPHSPTDGKPEPNPELSQAREENTVGSTALVSSAAAVLIKVVMFLGMHSHFLNDVSLLFVCVGFGLGITSRSSLAGRLALLGPLLFLGLFAWRGV